jgi:hypothetical protein
LPQKLELLFDLGNHGGPTASLFFVSHCDRDQGPGFLPVAPFGSSVVALAADLGLVRASWMGAERRFVASK